MSAQLQVLFEVCIAVEFFIAGECAPPPGLCPPRTIAGIASVQSLGSGVCNRELFTLFAPNGMAALLSSTHAYSQAQVPFTTRKGKDTAPRAICMCPKGLLSLPLEVTAVLPWHHSFASASLQSLPDMQSCSADFVRQWPSPPHLSLSNASRILHACWALTVRELLMMCCPIAIVCYFSVSRAHCRTELEERSRNVVDTRQLLRLQQERDYALSDRLKALRWVHCDIC